MSWRDNLPACQQIHHRAYRNPSAFKRFAPLIKHNQPCLYQLLINLCFERWAQSQFSLLQLPFASFLIVDFFSHCKRSAGNNCWQPLRVWHFAHNACHSISTEGRLSTLVELHNKDILMSPSKSRLKLWWSVIDPWYLHDLILQEHPNGSDQFTWTMGYRTHDSAIKIQLIIVCFKHELSWIILIWGK